MEYKRSYSQEEVHELYGWFKDFKYEGPVDIGHGQFVKNAKDTVNRIIMQTEGNIDNPIYSGMIHQLGIIKDELIRQGLVDKQ